MTHVKASHSPSTERSRCKNEDAVEAENDNTKEKYRHQWSTPLERGGDPLRHSTLSWGWGCLTSDSIMSPTTGLEKGKSGVGLEVALRM